MKKNSVFVPLLLFLTAAYVVPVFTFANGGDQRVVGNEYLINFARSPFTPIAGTKTAMTVSFVDLTTGQVIKDDILVTVRVGEGRGSTTFTYEEKDILVRGGILEWSYTFNAPGIHELFFNFVFVSDPQKIYEPPDFLLDIQKPETAIQASGVIFTGILSAFGGGIIGWVIRRKTKTP